MHNGSYVAQKICLKYTDTGKLKIKRWQKIHLTNMSLKKACVAILMLKKNRPQGR